MICSHGWAVTRQCARLTLHMPTENTTEDDLRNWFTSRGVDGPAIITAIIGDCWGLYDREPGDPFEANALYSFAPGEPFHKFLLPLGKKLRQHPLAPGGGFVSGYRIPVIVRAPT